MVPTEFQTFPIIKAIERLFESKLIPLCYKRNASPCYGCKLRRSHRPLEKHGSAKFHVDVKEEGGEGV